MKLILFVLSAVTIFACNSSSIKQEPFEKEKIDSCSFAVKFPNAVMTEQQVDAGFTGDLNNYWGSDTTKLDIKHTFVNGEIVASKFFYENGLVQEEYNFKCQSLHGEVKYYYDNGKLGKVIPHRYGRKNGTAYSYDSLGIVNTKLIFENDSMVSGPTVYDENAVLIDAEIENK